MHFRRKVLFHASSASFATPGATRLRCLLANSRFRKEFRLQGRTRKRKSAANSIGAAALRIAMISSRFRLLFLCRELALVQKRNEEKQQSQHKKRQDAIEALEERQIKEKDFGDYYAEKRESLPAE
jgi:hypothetical protein